MAKPNISPLTFRPSERALEFVDELKARGLTTTEIIQAALYALEGRMSMSMIHPAFDAAKYIKELARDA